MGNSKPFEIFQVKVIEEGDFDAVWNFRMQQVD